MKTGKVMLSRRAALFSLVLLMHAGACVCAPVPPRLGVPMTLVQDAAASEALCLDGSLPAYHIHKGTGAGADNWLLQFEGGAWCNDLRSCKERAKTRRGSTTLMNKLAPFSGILSNNPSLNPDFHDWTRVKLRYCDGASFTGDAVHKEGDSVLYFRGSRIWEAIIRDLIPKGLGQAKKALLSGCSAGGLSAFLHCDNFTKHLPPTAEVKCLSDAGFFLDAKDISNRFHMRSLFMEMITLQCFFPQYLLKNVQTPLFILNSAYDVFQFSHILAPPSADRPGRWQRCRSDPAACSPEQINILQGFRDEMLAALKPHEASKGGGMFINSCFAHCQSESQDTWLAADSPKVNNKGISEAVGDWYFNRKPTKEIDCPYPCDKTCHNLIPEPKDPADPSETNSQI